MLDKELFEKLCEEYNVELVKNDHKGIFLKGSNKPVTWDELESEFRMLGGGDKNGRRS